MPIPTIEILRGLTKEGFVPVGVKQSASCIEGKANYTKHLIRLRRVDNGKTYNVGDNVCEILLKNANDGTRSDNAFFEVALWHLPEPVLGSTHSFKYRLALIIDEVCVLRYDNERGKGDHRHIGDREEPILSTTLEALFDAFQADMERILR